MNTVANNAISPSNSEKVHALIAYFLMITGMFTVIPVFIGAVWAMIKKRSARGTLYHSHYVNATRTFWWSIFWTIIGCIFLVAGVGVIVFGITWLWMLYRLIKGLAAITADEPYLF